MKFDCVDHFKILKSARSVVFAGREIGGKEKHFFEVSDVLPYFGVPWKQRNIHKRDYGVLDIGEHHDHLGRQIAKITVKRADDVTRMRDSYTMTYESKELFHDRVKIDLQIKSGFELPTDLIKGKCLGCGGKGYHKIHSSMLRTW